MHPASKYLRICIYATIVQTSWIAYSCVHKSRWKHTQTQIESNANPDKSQQKCNVLCIQLQVFTNMYLCNHCADFVNCIFMCAQISWKHTQTQIESNANPDKSQQKCNVLCIQLPSIYEYVSMQPLCRLRELHIHVCTNLDENILKLKSRAMQTPTNLSKSVMFCASSFQVFTNMYLCNHCADFVNCIFMCAQISMKTYSNSNREQCKPRQISAKV